MSLPAASIISVKVLDDYGAGQTSWLLNGLDWVLQNKTTYNIRVVNLSLGTTAIDSYRNDPVCLKVKELVRNGIIVVAAAGNLGETRQRSGSLRTHPFTGQTPACDHGRCKQ